MSSSPVRMRRSLRSNAFCLLALVLLCGVDLGSKVWAADQLSEPISSPPPVCDPSEHGHAPPQRNATRRISLIDDHLEFHYTENCGAAFGLLRNAPATLRQVVLGGAALLASMALFWMFAKGQGGVAFAFAVPCIIAGALGNLVDRARLGYVVDFIRLYWSEPIPLLGHAWPTINVADMAITVGVALLLIDSRRRGSRAPANVENGPIAA
ncbi:MAG: signal peptidase II [Polyangiales bacterium]|jgi:signal peptidase II